MSTTLRRRRRIVAVLLVLAGLIVLVIGGSMGWVHLGAGGKTFIAASVPEEPVAIVFGAGLSPDGSPSAFLGYRLDVAADLYHRGKVAVILVSGDNRTVDHDEPNAMRDYLIELGVPSDRIVRDYTGAARMTPVCAQRRFSPSRRPCSSPRNTTCPGRSPCATPSVWSPSVSPTSRPGSSSPIWSGSTRSGRSERTSRQSGTS